MAKLVWDQIGEKVAESGVSKGVLYPMTAGVYGDGVAWNGLTSINEAPTGGEPSPFYANNHKYLELMSEEEFAGSLGCYTYPDEFGECIGEKNVGIGASVSQQVHKPFGLSYQTTLVNDTEGIEYGFKIHLVYGALAGVTSRDHTTMNDSPELEELSFDFTTTKVDVTDHKPTSHFVLDSTKFTAENQDKLTTIMDQLYGTTDVEPKLLLPDEIIAILTTP